MKTIVFCGNYSKEILLKAKKIGRVFWSDHSNLREMLEKVSNTDTVFVNTGHVDVEMLEDSPCLREIVCSENIWNGLEISAVSALGIIALQMPDSSQDSDIWTELFEDLLKSDGTYTAVPILNYEVYHHPAWTGKKNQKRE